MDQCDVKVDFDKGISAVNTYYSLFVYVPMGSSPYVVFRNKHRKQQLVENDHGMFMKENERKR